MKINNIEFVFIVVVVSAALTWLTACVMVSVQKIIDKYFATRLQYLKEAYTLDDKENHNGNNYHEAA